MTDKSLHKIGFAVMVLLMKIKLKVQLNTARWREKNKIIILDFQCFLTEKKCVEIINNLPKQNIITKVSNYKPIENKLTGKKIPQSIKFLYREKNNSFTSLHAILAISQRTGN